MRRASHGQRQLLKLLQLPSVAAGPAGWLYIPMGEQRGVPSIFLFGPQFQASSNTSCPCQKVLWSQELPVKDENCRVLVCSEAGTEIECRCLQTFIATCQNNAVPVASEYLWFVFNFIYLVVSFYHIYKNISLC